MRSHHTSRLACPMRDTISCRKSQNPWNNGNQQIQHTLSRQTTWSDKSTNLDSSLDGLPHLLHHPDHTTLHRTMFSSSGLTILFHRNKRNQRTVKTTLLYLKKARGKEQGRANNTFVSFLDLLKFALCLAQQRRVSRPPVRMPLLHRNETPRKH